MFEYSLGNVAEMLYQQPDILKYWIRWLGVMNMACIFFVWKHYQARWVAVAMLIVIAANVPIAMALGLVKALAIPHLFAWIPLVVYLAMQVRKGKVQTKSIFGIWVLMLMVTNTVSIIFDIRDTVEYIAGDRGIVAISSANIPYAMLAVCLVSVAALAFYCKPNSLVQESS